MKMRKLLFLFALVTALTLLVTSCGKEADPKSVLDYFAPSAEGGMQLSKVEDLDGKLVAKDAENGLVVVEKTVSDSTSLYLYDLNRVDSLGKPVDSSIFSTSYSQQGVELDVIFDYPLFYVKRTNTETNDTSYTCYLYRRGDYSYEMLAQGMESRAAVRNVNGLSVCTVNETVYWINSFGTVLRSFPADIAGDYRLPEFTAEYHGYLYLYEENELNRRLQVFNKEGICCASYTPPTNTGIAHMFLLNDGNVFIEEWLLAEKGEKFDFQITSQTPDGKIDKTGVIVSSKIVNFRTGEATELALDFTVVSLESVYAGEHEDAVASQEDSLFEIPFKLIDKFENQALIRRFSNGSFAPMPEYVVIDNEMNVVHGFKLEVNGKEASYEMLADGKIIATVAAGKEGISYLLDDKCKVLAELPECEYTVFGDYILCVDGVYNLSMKKLYDFEKSFLATQFGGKYEEALSFSGGICLRLRDPLTGDTVYYAYNGSTNTFTNLALGEDERVSEIIDGMCYVVYHEEDKHYTLYAMDGTALLRTQGEMTVTNLGTMLVVEASVGGSPICYIIR